MPLPLQVDLKPIDLESGVRVSVTCASCANFSLPRPLCSRLRPDVSDRQTDVKRQRRGIITALKGKRVHTLDIAPLRSESPLQKRSVITSYKHKINA